MKPSILALLVSIISWTAVTSAQEQLVIEAFESSGQIQFSKVSNAVSYRVEWAPSAGGNWTNFSAGAAYLDEIISPGSGVATAYVPMVYRVVATVTNPPPPPGMSLIPAGEFVMGDAFSEYNINELPLHTVYVSAFYMDQYEVTKGLWDAVKAHNEGNGYSYSNTGQGKATNHPVHTVNWFDAVKWCNARSEMEGLTPVYYTDEGFTTVYKTGEVAPYADWTANGYRLPTEAEWEKAARGGVAGQRFPWGDTITHSNANYYALPSSFSYDVSPTFGNHPKFEDGTPPYTSPVGYFAPNGYDLYDISGNVWEWCWDWFGENYYSISPSTDPIGPPSGDSGRRVLRSGSWGHVANITRIALRGANYPDHEVLHDGFRCARGL